MNSRNLICLILTTIYLLGCQSYKNATSHGKMFKGIYVHTFKITYIHYFLRKAYNNSLQIQHLLEVDHSRFTEPILTHNDYKLIDSLTSSDNLKLTIDSTNSIGRLAEGAEGKQIFGFLLNRIESKWLDSLARNRYKYAKVDVQYPK